MKVILHTNIDAYRGVDWPEFTDHVPRKGEIIELEYAPLGAFNRKYPPRLEVCQVRYKRDRSFTSGAKPNTVAYVELWFSETDFKFMEEELNYYNSP